MKFSISDLIHPTNAQKETIAKEAMDTKAVIKEPAKDEINTQIKAETKEEINTQIKAETKEEIIPPIKQDGSVPTRKEIIALAFQTNMAKILKHASEDDLRFINNSKRVMRSLTEFSHSQHLTSWNPVFTLDPSCGVGRFTLKSLEILPLRPGTTFVLDSHYNINTLLPRSVFSIIQQHNIGYTFVFKWPEPDNVFFRDMAGMRQSTMVTIRDKMKEEWQLHLKPTKERTNIFGYLVKAVDIAKIVNETMLSFVKNRKLPLVLDLDDTLVRVVGTSASQHVSEEDALKVPERTHKLKDGRKVVLAHRVHEFLEWASKFYEISVCSLGEQSYVDMVVSVLDPSRSFIRGIVYSARAEYMYISQSSNLNRPPKDLQSLYCFYNSKENAISIDPLILDDNFAMWPQAQQDNVIVAKEDSRSVVWNVNLFPVVKSVLNHVHESFFKKLDAWVSIDQLTRGDPPKSIDFYKEYLRRELSTKMGQVGNS